MSRLSPNTSRSGVFRPPKLSSYSPLNRIGRISLYLFNNFNQHHASKFLISYIFRSQFSHYCIHYVILVICYECPNENRITDIDNHWYIQLFSHFASNLSTSSTNTTSHHITALLTTVLFNSFLTSHQTFPLPQLIQHHII